MNPLGRKATDHSGTTIRAHGNNNSATKIVVHTA